MDTPETEAKGDSGKVGVAFLLWLLGVPGFIILTYLLFT
jgi:hypothetical protein